MQFLNGVMHVSSEQGETDVNVASFLDQPLENIRTIAPTSWNQTGTVPTSVTDKTVGGLLPRADADTILKHPPEVMRKTKNSYEYPSLTPPHFHSYCGSLTGFRKRR